MTEMLASATTAVETHNKQSKGDIVQQIKDLYMRKGHRPADELNRVHLVPTKAALFGLDVRFRVIEQKMLQDKINRSSFTVGKGKKSSEVGNRHQYPSTDKITTLRKTHHHPFNFKTGTCFDQVITDDLNYILPSKVSYLVNDSKPKTKLGPVDHESQARKYVSATVQSEIFKIEDRKIEAFLMEEKR